MPYINEILNLLTIVYFKPYLNLEIYPHAPHNFIEMIKKTIIDFLAITGIVVNSAYNGEKYNYTIGLIKGILLSFFTFLIPNIFMAKIIKIPKSNLSKGIVGFIFIYFLDVFVNLFTCIAKEYY